MSHSLIHSIGNTPLVEIGRINPSPNVRIFAKLEQANPGGSIKDRAALFMIEDGEKSGKLTPQKTVIEATSGNTGIGLAMVCAVKGYRLVLAMAESASEERKTILKARGAHLLLTPGHLGTDGAIEEVYRLARENPEKYFMADQYNNPANWQAHFCTTAPEILRQTNEKVAMVVATMGTTGTLMGLSRRLKQTHPHIQIIGVEPYMGHKIQGLKNMKESYCPEIYEKNRLDKVVNIEDELAFETVRRLAKEEGLFVGMSSGAAMAAALQQAETLKEGMIVAIFPDGGERYLSTPLFSIPARIGLHLFNTQTRKKEIFTPKTPNNVGIYSCGPTAHAPMHPGELRRMVFSDLIVRYLKFKGFDTTHVMNITDLDDKTITGSEKAGQTLKEFTRGHIDRFKQELKILNILPADVYPLAGDHVEDAVNLTRRLLEKGAAYEKLRSIYFDISRFSEYGKLSNVNLNKIRLGATVDLDTYEKENPRDFTLLKRIGLSELKRGIFTKTPWGNVRPSWHIQCAAMSMKYLGDSFDIHAAGRELIFPHHENEMAIAKAATGKPLARFWLHCERVLIDDKKPEEKESRITLSDLMDAGLSGPEIRYWLISRHYRKPISIRSDHLSTELSYAGAALKRLNAFMDRLGGTTEDHNGPESDQLVFDLKQGFSKAMDDDLNVPAALAVLFQTVRKANGFMSKGNMGKKGAARLKEAVMNLNQVLGILPSDDSKPVLHENSRSTILELMQKREDARRKKDFETADKIRSQLQKLGAFISDPSIKRL